MVLVSNGVRLQFYFRLRKYQNGPVARIIENATDDHLFVLH